MMLPLYADAPKDRPPEAHRGLWHAKFFHGWPDDRPPDSTEPAGKLRWLKCAAQEPCGDNRALDESRARLEALAAARQGHWLEVVTEAPLVTGIGLPHPVETNLVFHPTLGVPYVPAASLKGVVRAWARLVMPTREAEVDKLFGGPSAVGEDVGVAAVSLLDALPIAPLTLCLEVMTPHYGAWYQKRQAPGDWMDPVPVSFLVIEQRARFGITILPRDGTSEEMLKQATTLLKGALAWLGAGAKTGLGFGIMNEPGTTVASSPAAGERYPVGSQCLFEGKPHKVVAMKGDYKRIIAPLDAPKKRRPVKVQALKPPK